MEMDRADGTDEVIPSFQLSSFHLRIVPAPESGQSLPMGETPFYLRLVSLLGIASFLALAWVLSNNRKAFPWRVVASGLALQLVLGLLILKTSPGRALFLWAQDLTEGFINVCMEGAALVFGPLARNDLLAGQFGPANGVVLAITISATIIVVSAISQLLYHWGILQKVVQGFALVMEKAMKLSGAESLAAAANIFVGQTEAPLVVKPYISRMTQSELMAMMVGGMATIAGGVLAIYVSLGIEAGHLLTASVMSAPAALLVAKILLPETEISETASGARAKIERTTTNGLDALCKGTTEGMTLSINVIAMLLAFTAIVALVNKLLAIPQGDDPSVTLQVMLGWVNAPFAFLMGIPPSDCVQVGGILGERVVLNEFIGYLSLTGAGETLGPRSKLICTYALCGFANFASIAIQIGGISVLAPERRKDLAKFGLKSMVGGLLACYLTASVVGVIG